MELLTMSKVPYQQQVQEWQYTTQNDAKDSNWIKGPYNTYGKMVTQNFLTPDGTKHAQKKQMEIVQARTSSGALQVVRAQTVQSMSSRTSTDASQLFSPTKKFYGASTQHQNQNGDRSQFSASPISLSNIDNNRIVVKMRNDHSNGFDGTLNRGKSISNDDLPKTNGSDDESEFGQWSRVSRIRRSLQFPSPSSQRSSRPTDFPQESVDVSKIRQELENISRRNSFVKSSSNESTSSSSESKEANKIIRPIPDNSDLTPVTANILKQVRSQLKRLDSNESTPESPSFLRRKSYAFEKLDTPDPKMESSTDSGLSLSNDLHSPWTNSPRTSTRVKLSPTRITLFSDSHLISHPHDDNSKTKRYTTALENILVDNYDAKKQTKKVEFCKTEIHFAPDSGRVNIVETDGKPLPSTNFRRRRRTTSNSSVSSAMYSEEENDVPVVPQQGEAKVSVITEVQAVTEPMITEPLDTSEELRGILKNKPVKPKPYHLGENDVDSIWGVKLKPTIVTQQVSPDKPSAYSRLKEEREKTFDRDFGFSTKINLTRTSPIISSSGYDDNFVTKLEINETKPAHLIDSPGQHWSKPNESKRLISIAPEDELKCISLIKNTIKPNSSPVLNVNSPSSSENILAETTKIKHDLDEAFKDLLSVSASLREIENRASKQRTLPDDSKARPAAVTLKPVPAPRKRPTTLDIKSPITPASPTEAQKSIVRGGIETLSYITPKPAPVRQGQYDTKANTPIQIQLYSPTNSLQRPTTKQSNNHPTPLPRSTLSDSESVVKPRVSKVVGALQQNAMKSGMRQLKQHELSYFGIGENRPGSSKVEKSSSYRNGYSSAQKYESSGDEVETRSSLKRIMEQRQVESAKGPAYEYDRKLDRKRDEEILDELTKASEEILNTVKQMEEKEKDKDRKRRSSKNSYQMEILETITEKPTPARAAVSTPRHTKERSIIREERKSSLSSASSSECLSPFARASRYVSKSSSSSVREKKKEPITNGCAKHGKTQHRECRRILRTPSRELAQSQTRGSSSEDLAVAIVEQPRRIRRTKGASDEVASVARRPRQPTPRESSVSSSVTSRDRIYTHRLRKVDNISKPSTASTSRRVSSRTKTSSGVSSKTK